MNHTSICNYSKAAARALSAFLIFAAVAPTLAAPAATAGDTPRQHLRLDSNWRFTVDHSPQQSNSSIGGDPVTAWRTMPVTDASIQLDTVSALPPGLDSSPQWASVNVGTDVFHGQSGYAWFETDLEAKPAPKAGIKRILYFEGVDDNCAVFFNGKLLKRHEGYDDPFGVDLTSIWQPGGMNRVTVLVQNTAGGGGIAEPVSLLDSPIHPAPAKPQPVPVEAKAAFDASLWRVVHLPHDYVVEQQFTPNADTGHGSLPTPPAWYRRTFTLPANDRGKAVELQFDGVYRDAKVYLNGILLGEHPSGYTGFRYAISGAAKYGAQNVLAVHVDPSKYEGWFYEGGGIYRHVWLNVTNPVHVANDGGVYVTTQLPEPKALQPVHPATVTIRTRLVGPATGQAKLALRQSIIDDSGNTVASASISGLSVGKDGARLQQSMTVPHPRLWSLDSPHLYQVKTIVLADGHVVDSCETPFGIRTLRFDPNRGFFLNGRRTEIQGTCNHQDFAGVGTGMPDSILYWRIKKLKQMGCNAYRCSHNPVAPELLDDCDKLGMLVMDENRHLGDTYHAKSTHGTPVGDLADLREMLLQDRNHPSIIMWSLCNEEFSLQGTTEGAQIYAAMMRVGKQYDATRPYTCAMNGEFGTGISNVEELQGFNYNSGDYDSFHAGHPNQPCFGSETSSEVTTRGEYADNAAKGYVQAYDTESPQVNWGVSAEDGWKPIVDRPWMEGGFVWTGFDYKGEPTPYGWPDINSNFGILDEAGFPKDNFYYYQSVWSGKPVVHIVPGNWNLQGQEGTPIKVWCYSNADSVELFLNDKSLGAKPVPRYGHVEWMVPYQPGTLRAQGSISYNTVATDQIETTGPAAALRLTVDDAAQPTLKADGEDAVVLDVAVVDAQGRVVPDADDQVTFSSSGAAVIAGTGNGDPSDHEPDRSPQRKAFHGLCMAVAQAPEGQGGTAKITSSAPGLKPASITLKITPPSVSQL